MANIGRLVRQSEFAPDEFADDYARGELQLPDGPPQR
jgi:hypothetical protein